MSDGKGTLIRVAPQKRQLNRDSFPAWPVRITCPFIVSLLLLLAGKAGEKGSVTVLVDQWAV